RLVGAPQAAVPASAPALARRRLRANPLPPRHRAQPRLRPLQHQPSQRRPQAVPRPRPLPRPDLEQYRPNGVNALESAIS
ncbi:hypothetical protein FRB96_009102, partial [Tulasnella sp. 330]